MPDAADLPPTPTAAAPAPEPAAPAVVETPQAPSAPVAAEPAPPSQASAEPSVAADGAAAGDAAKPSPAEVAQPEPEQSLLSQAAEPPKEGEAPKPEEKPADAVTLPAFDTFALPEGVKLDEKLNGDFAKLLGTFETESKLPHDAVQKLGQQLVDFYVNEQRQVQDRANQLMTENWNRTREGWRDQFKSDSEIGGNARETTIKRAGAVLERYGAEHGPNHLAELRQVLSMTGAGDHPAVIRFVNWASRFTVERARPVAAVVPKAPVVASRSQRRYGNNSGAA